MKLRQDHWENIYQTKSPKEVSWTQIGPTSSLALINKYANSHDDPIIDIGGGDSHLVDLLIDAGYTDISVLDISEKALERAKERIGPDASKVTWIHSDVAHFKPSKHYKIWHDRAAFHFLTSEKDIASYRQLLEENVDVAIMATFSMEGPLKCSGLEIVRYDSQSLLSTMGKKFSLLESFNEDHQTPFDTTQNFQFVVAEKMV